MGGGILLLLFAEHMALSREDLTEFAEACCFHDSSGEVFCHTADRQIQVGVLVSLKIVVADKPKARQCSETKNGQAISKQA